MATRTAAEQPRAPRTPVRARLAASSPWLPAPYVLADVSAAKALAAGTASAEQQQRFLRWVIEAAAGTYEQHYRPGAEDGARDTIFALGRAFVGQQVVKLVNINPANVRRDEPRADPSEHHSSK